MYMRPETVDAHNVYWSLIKKHLTKNGIECPAQLSAPEDLYENWNDPALLLSQTCGMPYRNSLHNKVQLIGTPDFKLDGCPPGYYRSAVVVRREDKNKTLDDFKQAVFVYNSDDSQSGFGSVYLLCKSRDFWFRNRIASGSHRESTIAIAEGRADIAAIDAVTWRLIQTFDSHAGNLSVIDWTDPTPGLPYITSLGNNGPLLYDALSAAIEELTEETRQLLGIHAMVKISAEDYCAVANPSD